METVSDILHDAKFWTAVVALANALLLYFVPAFPVEIWVAIDAVLALVIGSLVARSAVVQRQVRVAARQRAARGL